MFKYILQRLTLIPITLCCILIVNMFIISIAPGEPSEVNTTVTDGEIEMDESNVSLYSDATILFRRHYGLNMPLFINLEPFTSNEQLLSELTDFNVQKAQYVGQTNTRQDFKASHQSLIDKSSFIVGQLTSIAQNENIDSAVREIAHYYAIQGALKLTINKATLTAVEREHNREVGMFNSVLLSAEDKPISDYRSFWENWRNRHKDTFHFNTATKLSMMLTQTRFVSYFTRVLTLDFGTLRKDPYTTVLSAVTKRLPISLTLAIIPAVISSVLCLILGCIMAATHNTWIDKTLNLVILVLYALPIFVVGPFVIEYLALKKSLGFMGISFPISGFTSAADLYQNMTTWQRLNDIIYHAWLPFFCICYGSFAAQARIARTAVLDVIKQDYVISARSRGIGMKKLYMSYILKNASITIVTSLAGSLGLIFGGSLIIETLFDIPGFGKFFYEAIIERDYNVIMFSTLVGAALTLIGYLVSDVLYMILDPRIELKE
jgi:peptide/nickel transport system permease protein